MYAPHPTAEHTDNFVAISSGVGRINLSKSMFAFLFYFSKFQICETQRGEQDLFKDSTFMLQNWGGGEEPGAPSPLR